MALNLPGPAEVRIYYTTVPTGQPAMQHVQRLNCVLDTTTPTLGQPFSTYNVTDTFGTGTKALDSAVDQIMVLMSNRFPASTSFDTVELWYYTLGTTDAQFISAYSPAVTAGVNPGVSTVAGQEIYTFRSANGGNMRIALMEGVTAIGNSDGFPTGTGSIDAYFDYFTSSLNWVRARDNGFPFAKLRYHPGQNERIFKKRFRN